MRCASHAPLLTSSKLNMYKQVEVLIHRVSSDSPPLTHSYNKGRLGKGAVLSQCFVTPRFSAQSQVPVSPALHPQTHARSLSGDLQLPECASTRRSRAARRHPGGGASSLAPHSRLAAPAGCVAHSRYAIGRPHHSPHIKPAIMRHL